MRKKIAEMDRDELLEVVWRLVDSITAKVSHDLQPNRTANKRHQYHKHVWGQKKLALLGLLHRAVEFCPPELADEINAVLHHEENHYHRRNAATERKRQAMLNARVPLPDSLAAIAISNPAKVE